LPQLENIPWWGKNILRRGRASAHLGRHRYIKYNKINNNSENFRRSKNILNIIK